VARALILALVVMLVTIAVTTTGLVYVVAFTPRGLATVVDLLPRRFGSIEVEIEGVSGTLAHGFRVRRLVIDQRRARTVIETATGRIAITPFLWQTISSPKIEVEGVHVQVRAVPPRKVEPKFLPRLLRIRADDVFVRSTTIVSPQGQVIVLRDAHLSGSARHKVIRLYTAVVDYELLHLDGRATLRAGDPIRVDAAARLTLESPEGTPWVASASADGDLDRLELEGAITEPFRSQFEGAGLDLNGRWRFEGTASIAGFDVADFGGGDVLGPVQGRLAIELDEAGIRAKGRLDPAGLAAGAFDVSFDGKYRQRGLDVRRIEARHGASRALATTAGRIDITDEGPRLDLTGDWQAFRWPLVGEAVAISTAGTYRLSGALPFDVVLGGDLVVPAVPGAAGAFALTGTLASDRLSARRLDVQALDGRAALGGEVTWAPAETWRLSGRISEVNPGRVRADLAGRLSFDLDARGEGFDEQGLVDLGVAKLTGRLRDVAASGGGRMRVRGETLELDRVDVRLGTTRVQANGRIAPEAVALSFDVATQDLALLDPEARGRVIAAGTIGGTRALPKIDVRATLEGFDYEGIRIVSAEGSAAFDARAGQPVDVRIRARGVEAAGRIIESLDIEADGTTEQHRFDVAARSAPIRIAAKGVGRLESGEWTALLDSLELRDPDDTLRLESPATLRAGGGRLQVERTCLRGEAARLCGVGETADGRWNGEVVAEDLPLATFAAGLVPDVSLEGSIDGRATASGAPGTPWLLDARAELSEARARRRLSNGREEVTPLGGGELSVTATAEQLALGVELEASIAGGQKERISGRAIARRTGEEWRDWPLAGDVRVSTDALEFFAVLAGPIDRAKGRLEATLSVAGTLGAPRFTGQLSVRDGEFDLYQVNLALRGVSLDAGLLDNALTLQGRTSAGEGSAEFGGRLEWREGLPYGALTLKGEDLRVANVPEARILASPDLRFDVQGRRIDVTGEVQVPYARLDPADITTATFASADEVIVGNEPEDPSKRFVVTTEVRMTLGDRVTIDTLGLSGRLTGSLVATTSDEDVPRGTGELNVEDGKYLAYGRKLDIERGRLIFSNGPLVDPGIDIRASREFPDVTVGANVRGTLQSPRLTLFSDPPIAQSAILSLLIAGGSLQSTQAADGRNTNPLAVQGGAILAQQLGSYVGLEDVSIESTLANETALVLGKYLTPRLYVSYGISLTEAINTFKMRYTLGDRWTMKLESGANQSADLEYTIER
jgi:translocation and assembly module TamB